MLPLASVDPEDPDEFAQALLKSGYSNKAAFPSTITFMESLAFVANLHDLQFLLDSGTFDFLIVSWVNGRQKGELQ